MELENAGAAAPVTDASLPPPEAPQEQAAPPAVENTEADLDAKLSQIFRNNNLERDESGRFKAREPAVTQETVSKDQPPVAATETAKPSIQRPIAWSADHDEWWKALPPERQEFLAKREGESHTKITQQGEQIAQFEPVNRVIDNYRGAFERHGITIDEGLNRVLAANDWLDRDPHTAIGELMRMYGVNPSSYLSQQDENAPESAFHQHLTGLQSEVNQLKYELQQERQTKAATEQKSVKSQIDEFSKDKPDWAELEEEIIAQVMAVNNASPGSPPLERLQKAYERARWSHPASRERIQKEQREAEAKKNQEEATKRAAAAKAAASVNVRSETANGNAAMSLDDTLRSVYRKQHS